MSVDYRNYRDYRDWREWKKRGLIGSSLTPSFIPFILFYRAYDSRRIL